MRFKYTVTLKLHFDSIDAKTTSITRELTTVGTTIRRSTPKATTGTTAPTLVENSDVQTTTSTNTLATTATSGTFENHIISFQGQCEDITQKNYHDQTLFFNTLILQMT